MYKANGRVGRPEKLEKAKAIGKVFICPVCGKENAILNVEFGEEELCSECSALTVEQSD